MYAFDNVNYEWIARDHDQEAYVICQRVPHFEMKEFCTSH